MSRIVLMGVCVGLAMTTLTAQTQQPKGKFWVYGQNVEQRASTRIGYWRTNANAGIGEVVVSYGRPPWKEQYSQQLDQMTQGKMWRMGDNYWSLFDTNLPVKVGGVDVSVGLYYLAVKRSSDGEEWELVFIDPAKSRERGLDSFDVGTRPAQIPVLFTAPLTFEKTSDAVDRLTMVLSLDQGSKTIGSLRITWGNLALTTPVAIDLPAEYLE